MLTDSIDFSVINWVALLGAVLSCVVLLFAAGRPFRLTRTPVALALFSMAMVVLGSVCYVCTRVFQPDYYVELTKALVYTSIGMLSASAGVYFVRKLPRSASRQLFTWSATRLDAGVIVLLVLVIIGTFGSLAKIGYIPVLRGDISDARLQYAATAGVFYRLSLLGVSAAILAGVRWMAFGRSLLGIATIGTGLVCASLYGPRYFPFLAVGTLFTLFDLYVRPVRVWQVFAIGIPMLILALVGAIHRESAGAFAFDRPGMNVDPALGLVVTGYFTFNEFREFAWSIQYYENPERRLHGKTMIGGLMAPVPGKVWSALGVDKDEYFDFDQSRAMQVVLKERAGIRVGLVGELYMNFGVPGIVIGMGVFGMLVGWIDRRLTRRSIYDPFAPLFAMTSLTLIFLMIGIISHVPSTIVFYGMPIVVMMLVACREYEPVVGGPRIPVAA